MISTPAPVRPAPAARLDQQARASSTRCISPPESFCIRLSSNPGADRASASSMERRLFFAELEEAAHRQRQGGVQIEALGNIADPQIAAANDFAGVRLSRPSTSLLRVLLPAPAGADQGGDFAFVQGKGDLCRARVVRQTERQTSSAPPVGPRQLRGLQPVRVII